MLRRATLTVLALVIVLSTIITVSAQTPQPQAPQPEAAPASGVPLTQVAPTPTGKQVLREGTDVSLRFAEDISSKTAAVDDTIAMVLDEDIKVGDIIVARAGAKAVATVSNVRKAGMMGKAVS